ncbi:MAG: T9SS type A sorting domain-containing protein [Bacteroidetes bacterium]|nr:T9SS type A sorting domain-containing protein [Bacteroidota bacterium]
MKRSDFIKGVGLAGVGTVLPWGATKAIAADKTTGTCVLIPSETEGPFPLDLTTNNAATYFRQDLREDRTGVTLNLKMKIIGLANCLPMANVRVNIWSCDKDGIYSGYNTSQNAGSTTATYLRGYQMTDANGEVNFVTIFPGWYTGRICHIHFQVYVSSVYKAVSQLTFDATTKNALYAANSSLYTKGADPITVTSDNIFSDGYSQQIASLTQNTDGSYSSYLEVTIDGSGSTGLVNYEGETGGQFKLGQNYPNPHNGITTIPFTLNTASEVKIEIFDLNARKVGVVDMGTLQIGDHTSTVNLESMGIAYGNYLYQLDVTNSNGVFRQCKMMTAQ